MKPTIIITSLAILVLITITGIILYTNFQNQPLACTMEAKLCEDGSSVGRTGPNCDFAPCPLTQEANVSSCADQPGTTWCAYKQACLPTTGTICPPEISPDFDQIGRVAKTGTQQGEGLSLITADESLALIFNVDSWCGNQENLISCLALSVSDYGLVDRYLIRIMGHRTAEGIEVLRAIRLKPIATTKTDSTWLWPLKDAEQRITKKPFGIQITPSDSPVTPEKFSGYHTGADFEILASEAKADLPVSAICDGKLRIKRWSSGYGGVAVQDCNLNNEPVTVIYGHLRLDSITSSVGDTFKAGQVFALLGEGYSEETDQERPHLHLAIHRGSDVLLLGYVPSEDDLADWLDPISFLSSSSPIQERD